MTFHDSEISKFNEVIGVFSGQDRIYKNKPSYVSENSAYFGLKLSGYLTNDHSEKIDSVRFTINAAKEILVSYYDKNAILIYTKELGEKIEFKNGKITLDHFSSCASRDTPGVGCEWSSVTLSENKDGDLSAVKNGGGAGLIGLIVPVGVNYSYLAIYDRIIDISKYPRTITLDNAT